MECFTVEREVRHCKTMHQHIVFITNMSSNAADHWQQCIHQQHMSTILHVDFSARFNLIDIGITDF